MHPATKDFGTIFYATVAILKALAMISIPHPQGMRAFLVMQISKRQHG